MNVGGRKYVKADSALASVGGDGSLLPRSYLAEKGLRCLLKFTVMADVTLVAVLRWMVVSGTC